jgi:hypothetical protein
MSCIRCDQSGGDDRRHRLVHFGCRPFSASRTRARTGTQGIANAAREASLAPGVLGEAWFDEHWVLLEHATTRAALAAALLPVVWRWFEIEDFSPTTLTSFVIMFVPGAVVREGGHRAIIERMTHRALGCLLGSAVALVSLSALGDTLLPTLMVLFVGVWVGHHIQNGRNGVSYFGTQFVLGLLITLVQGPGPIIDYARSRTLRGHPDRRCCGLFAHYFLAFERWHTAIGDLSRSKLSHSLRAVLGTF